MLYVYLRVTHYYTRDGVHVMLCGAGKSLNIVKISQKIGQNLTSLNLTAKMDLEFGKFWD